MQYGNEAVIGRALKDFLSSDQQSAGRHHLFITSKIWNDCHRPDAARHASRQNALRLTFSPLLSLSIYEKFLSSSRSTYDSAMQCHSISVLGLWSWYQKWSNFKLRELSTFLLPYNSEVCKQCRASVEKSMKDLGCEYLDLLLMHWPDAWKPGSQAPDDSVTIEQTWYVLDPFEPSDISSVDFEWLILWLNRQPASYAFQITWFLRVSHWRACSGMLDILQGGNGGAGEGRQSEALGCGKF